MSFRAWLSVFTLVLIAIIVFLSRHELMRAFGLLEKVDIWILFLLIPGQLLVYYTNGEMLFSYLRSKDSIKRVSGFGLARMSLEMNFVNHILPSGGVSGLSYMSWRLGGYGVSSSRAAMAQAVRFSTGFMAFIVLLLLALIIVTVDGNINRWIILMSSILIIGMISLIVAAVYLLSSSTRMTSFANWLASIVNQFVRKITFGHKRILLRQDAVMDFFVEMHHDYISLRHDKAILLKPFLWGIVLNLTDSALFFITFWALGAPVNPAPILIAYGVATVAGFFVMTPGGAGAYEAIMVAILAVAGIDQGTAIAGIVLTRVVLLVGTIVLGYAFYQYALIKYGKNAKPTT